MEEYTAVACAGCNQAIYLARRKLNEPFWDCPACGAENMTFGTVSPDKLPARPSRFARKRDAIPPPGAQPPEKGSVFHRLRRPRSA